MDIKAYKKQLSSPNTQSKADNLQNYTLYLFVCLHQGGNLKRLINSAQGKDKSIVEDKSMPASIPG